MIHQDRRLLLPSAVEAARGLKVISQALNPHLINTFYNWLAGQAATQPICRNCTGSSSGLGLAKYGIRQRIMSMTALQEGRLPS